MLSIWKSFAKRYVILILQLIGMSLIFIARTNLSLAIVDMTGENLINIGNLTTVKKPDFEWSMQEKGIILSLFSYGYLFSPLGGIVAVKFGGARMHGLLLLSEGVASMMTPLLLHFNLTLYAVVRVLEGAISALTMSTIAETFIRWIPTHERTRATALVFSGQYIGSSISYPFSGYLAYVYGWEAMFYATGSIIFIWCGIWITFVSDTPSTDRFITENERKYLEAMVPKSTTTKKIANYPFKKMFKSIPLWALLNEYFSCGWCFSFILSALPLYIKDMHNINVQEVGLLSSVPLICSIAGISTASVVADYFRSREILKIATIYRIFVAVGQLTSIICLLCIGFWANFTQSIIGFCLIRFFYAFTECATNVLPLDLCGGYASFFKGIANFSMSFCYILSPTVMGFMVSNHTRLNWNEYFLFLSIFNIWSAVIFAFFGSGELLEWAKCEADESESSCNAEQKA